MAAHTLLTPDRLVCRDFLVLLATDQDSQAPIHMTLHRHSLVHPVVMDKILVMVDLLIVHMASKVPHEVVIGPE